MNIRLIDDHSDPLFAAVFKQYFEELGVNVRDWDGLFREMNQVLREREMQTLCIVEEDGAAGFLQYQPERLAGWFFAETAGFIREFWVRPDRRGTGLGGALLEEVFARMRDTGIHKVLLTSDTAGDFYLRHGFVRDDSYAAKNGDPVYVRQL